MVYLLKCAYFIPKSVIVSVAMEARDDEDNAGQHIQSSNDSGFPSVSSNERTTGKLSLSIHSKINSHHFVTCFALIHLWNVESLI